VLAASRWLEAAAEAGKLADAAQSPEVRSALRELVLSYTASAAGLDARTSRPATRRRPSDPAVAPPHNPGKRHADANVGASSGSVTDKAAFTSSDIPSARVSAQGETATSAPRC